MSDSTAEIKNSETISRVGAFSPYTCTISAEAQSAFKEALDGIIGVTYTPVAVSQQVVAGLNYKFFCNTVASTRYPINGAAIVSIYKPLDGRAHITNIQDVN
ncbi:MAG: hypothetical protein JKY54_08295 [Flavobacteriales bacterium]|nr:hypothetical protein [Flavobacteriales bacterium]